MRLHKRLRIRLLLSGVSVFRQRRTADIKTAKTINLHLPFGVMNGVRPRNRKLGGRAHWRHLANTIERLCGRLSGSASIGRDAACSKLLWAMLLKFRFERTYYGTVVLVKDVHCKKNPCIHGYFVASFPYFNGTRSIYFVSVTRRNNEARAYFINCVDLLIQTYTEAGSVKIWKTRHKNINGYTAIFTL